MKIRFTLLPALLFCSGMNIYAQQDFQRRTVEERTKSVIDRITDSLKLDSTQRAATAGAFIDYYTALDKLRGGLQGGRSDKTVPVKILDMRDHKLKSIFTEEQYKKFKEVVEPSLRRPRNGIPVNN